MQVKKRTNLLLITLILSSVFIPISCGSGQTDDFGIYLADTGKIVLSGQDVKAYHSTYSIFELNESGIEKWNSFQTYSTIPKLDGTLFSHRVHSKNRR